MTRSVGRPPRCSLRVGACLCLVALAATLPATAQQPATPEAAKREQEHKRLQLEKTQGRVQEMQASVGDLQAERERLNARLIETARLIQNAEGRMTALEGRISELEEQEKLLRGSLEQRYDSIAKSLAAMQRMGRNPPPVIVTRREDALAMVRSAMMLAKVFPELRDKAEALAKELAMLERVIQEARSDREKYRLERERHGEMHVRLSALKELRSQSLAERQHELAELRKAAGEIERSVSDLGELIARLDEAVAKRTELGRYQESERAAAAARPPVVAPPPITGTQPAPLPPVAEKEPRREGEQQLAALPKAASPAIVLAPTTSPFAGNLGRMQPAIPFHLAKAKLPLPAQGKRVVAYGDRTPSNSRSNGIVIETRHGAAITSPADGWVVFAGPFRSYGQILIINAGGGYHILLAGMSQIDAQFGQFVQTNEPVGTMAAAPKSKAQDNAPVLYVEFRKEGRPIDPEPWWAQGQQKVQG